MLKRLSFLLLLFEVIARDHTGTQGKLAREHVSTQDTLAREHVCTQNTLARKQGNTKARKARW